MTNTVITLKMNQDESKRLYEAYKESASTKVPPYASYQLRVENCVITHYNSGKTVFQGKDAEVYSAAFQTGKNQVEPKKKKKPTKSHATTKPALTLPQAGSDEVGTGDYFGPVCVCCAIVTSKTIQLLEDLGVKDSKQVTDEKIREIAPVLMENVPHSLLVVEPIKYNEVQAFNNMNAIKAKLHNKAYINLSKRETMPDFKIIDQFTPEQTYYRYIQNEPEIQYGIHFETKAEDKYPSVGAGSIIARYAFLVYWDDMEKRFDMKFQKGASSKVDLNAKDFVERYGFENLKYVAKLHFKNTEKVKNLL